MSQTTYNRLQNKAFAGMIADIGIKKIVTRHAEAELDIGIGLVEGTTPEDVITPADSASQVFAGFSVQSHDRENKAVGVDDAVYAIDEPVNVGKFGAFWMQYTGTPVVGGEVKIAVDTGVEGKVKTGSVARLVLDADLVASNVFDITINGVAATSTTYATSHIATMTAILVNIEALASVQSAILDPEDATNRTIIITNTSLDIVITSAAVTAGATQAGDTTVYGNEVTATGWKVETVDTVTSLALITNVGA